MEKSRLLYLLASLLDGNREQRWRQAVALLSQINGVELANAPLALLRRCGLSRREALRCKNAFALCAVLNARGSSPSILSPKDAYAHFRPLLEKHANERFAILLLDSRQRLKKCGIVALGLPHRCPVSPAQVFRPALLHHASSIIVAHNHPAGDCRPSAEDAALTAELAWLGHLLDVPLLDHIVVAGNARAGEPAFCSLAHLGLLTQPKPKKFKERSGRGQRH